MQYSLRPRGENDADFLYHLYVNTRQGEFASLGWEAGQIDALLRMQFTARNQSYTMQFPDAYDHIILLDARPIGRMLLNGLSLLPGQERTTAVASGSIHLVDIALLPENRCQGTGTRILQDLQRAAARGKCQVTLQVQSGSPAARLYHRLGFSLTGQDAMYSQMAWTAEEG